MGRRESWRPVPGYEGFYEVSDKGRVRSLDRQVAHSFAVSGFKFIPGRVLVPVNDGKGYLRVGLTRNNKKTNVRIHKLVLQAFVGPCPPKQEVRHLNGVKTDNRLRNLKYGTKLENMLDLIEHGNHGMARKEVCKNGHPLVWHEKRQQRLCPVCNQVKDRGYQRKRTKKSKSLIQEAEIDTTIEIWKPIPAYEGLYSASDQGQIRSEERYVPHARWGRMLVRSRIMTGGFANGYRIVGLTRDGEFRSITVHTLVMLAFEGPCPEGQLIRHLNDNPVDNRLINLKYGTPQENHADYIRNQYGK